LVGGSAGAAYSVLTCGAVLLFPRLAFVMLSNNVLVLALRAMMADFIFLMILAVWWYGADHYLEYQWPIMVIYVR